MSALTRLERFDELFPELFRRFARPLAWSEDAASEIKIDITETDKAYDVKAEIPGAKKDDIRIVVDGNFVSIAAEFKKEHEEKQDGRILVSETYQGNVSRGFTLAHDIDDKAVKAKLEEGVLRLSLPKRDGVNSRLISVE